MPADCPPTVPPPAPPSPAVAAGPCRPAAAAALVGCQFHSFAVNWPDAIARLDAAGRYVFCNRAMEQLTGCKAQELVGRRFGDVLEDRIGPAAEDWLALREVLSTVVATGTMAECEIGITVHEQRQFLNIRLVAEPDEAGRVASVLLIGRNITHRKLTEEALRARERDLAEAQRIAQLGSWRLDHRTGVLTWSDELYRIFGYDQPPRNATFEAFLSRVHPDDRVRVARVSVQARLDGQPFRLEYRIVLPDGELRHLRDIGYAVTDNHGDVIGVFGTTQNITEHKRTETALRELKRTEEQLVEAQRDLARAGRAALLGQLTASIAHEVNQPLAGVVTNAEAALRWLRAPAPNHDEAVAALRRIIRDGKRAADVVHHVRALLNNGAPMKSAFNLDDAARELVALTHEEARRRNVAMRVRIAPGVPAVMADRVQVQQVLLNLTMNSFDALDSIGDRAREVLIEVEPADRGFVQVSVIDNGIGMTAAQFDHVFDSFYTTKDQGIGMGLAISRTIIEAHGGRLWATANAGPGVRFSFTVPAQESRQP